MAKCGCAGDRCSCTFTAGDGIKIEGTGTANNPTIISSTGTDTFLTVADSGTVDFTVTGDGSEDDPYVISATTTVALPTVTINTYTANGTWTKPGGKTMALITLVGSGGGGQAGNSAATGVTAQPSAPGTGAGVTQIEVPVSTLAASEAVVVGASVAGGVGASGTNVIGANGADGNPSSFAGFSAGGGLGGKPNVALPGGYGTDPGGGVGSVFATPIQYPQAALGLGAGPGGLGGSISSANAVVVGSAAPPQLVQNLAGGTYPGGAGNGPAGTTKCGATGGGGGASHLTTPTAGGVGGEPGGGGGGGGSTRNANTTGSGGASGKGRVVVVVW